MNQHPTSDPGAGSHDDERDSTAATTPIVGASAPAEASTVPYERVSDDDTADIESHDDSAESGDAFRARRKHRRLAALSIAAAVIFTAGAGGGSLVSLALARSTTATSSVDGGASTQQGGIAGQGTQGGFGGTSGGFGGTSGGLGGSSGGFGGSSGGLGGSSGTSTSTATAATAEQVMGIVTIVSQLGYEDGESAGSGIILTSTGRILTNNHVIDGSTAIKVTVESTGKSYTAKVVGTDSTQDIAVLQLENASGLTTASLDTGSVAVGDEVTAVGNANGTGTLSAAAGTVSATDQTITTQSDGVTAGETLNGLIEIDADVVSGDSGGAVKDADGQVIGVTTAASSGTADITGYAIPIATAAKVADQIVAGDDTSEITIGLPAFLGVSISRDESGTSGAVIGQILDGTPAASTGLAAGDTITKVDGTTISSGSALSKAIATHAVGDRITITYTDTSGDSHTATVTLTEGPAD